MQKKLLAILLSLLMLLSALPLAVFAEDTELADVYEEEIAEPFKDYDEYNRKRHFLHNY